jgi:MerR family transcriptional regulator, light-induced transcriptional regulator
MKTYTLREAAKKLGVAPHILKQWEKEFAECVTIPRTQQGARIFTEELLTQFRHIKEWLADGRHKQDIIRDFKQQLLQPIELKLPVMEGEIIDVPRSSRHDAQYIAEQLAKRMKEEIVVALKKETTEVLQQAMNEVKSYLNEIQDQSAATKQTVCDSLAQYAKTLQQETEEIHEHLENVVTFLQEEKNKQEQERKRLEEQIMEREKAFRELVFSFRQAAAGASAKRSNKWWKFW